MRKHNISKNEFQLAPIAILLAVIASGQNVAIAKESSEDAKSAAPAQTKVAAKSQSTANGKKSDSRKPADAASKGKSSPAAPAGKSSATTPSANASTPTTPAPAASAPPQSAPASSASSSSTGGLTMTASATGEISLNDLRDVGLCVMQIKQQAINIYLEVTRKAVTDSADAKMDDPSQISASGLGAEDKYLETRPEWLTFYVGTMEPIIHLFKADVKDVESGIEKIIVPKGTKDKFGKIVEEYEAAVEQLNAHLSNIYDEIHQPGNNVKIAREAIKIFELADYMEKGRQEAFRLVQQSAGTSETEELLPKKKD